LLAARSAIGWTAANRRKARIGSLGFPDAGDADVRHDDDDSSQCERSFTSGAAHCRRLSERDRRLQDKGRRLVGPTGRGESEAHTRDQQSDQPHGALSVVEIVSRRSAQ
jgi:hypothetical protein